tara:strand:+ start:91 stop:972 length:882 start_codon:yes stop_codon:yes gene_type:complete
MPYIGNQPADRFGSLVYQDLTGVTGSPVKRGFTLNQAVGNEMELEVFVNNVRQEPTVAYTVSGTTLTMTGDVETTDDFYVVFQGKAIGTVTHPSNTPIVATTGTFSDNVSTTGDFLSTGKEYFQVALTTATTGHSDGASTVVDFGGNGTVIHDTKSKFDSSNDAYEFASADGVYLISFSAAIRSDLVATEDLIEVGARVQFSTDNFSGTITAQNQEFGNAARVMDAADGEIGTITLTGQSIYKNNASGTKIRLQVISNTSGGSYEIESDTDGMINVTFGPSCRCTYLSVLRIA